MYEQEPEIFYERRRRIKGGWESESETWTEPDVESGSESGFAVVYNEEVPGGGSRVQTRSDRKTSPSQKPPFLSPLTSLLFCSVCGSVTFTLNSLLRPLWAKGSERRMSAADSKWNPKTQ